MKRVKWISGLLVFVMLLSLVACGGGKAKSEANEMAVITPQKAPGGIGAPKAEAAGEGVQITVYNDNTALVNDHRTIDLKKGDNEVRFSNVTAQIDPTSVRFSSLTDPENTQVLEQNFEYDLVNTQKLLEKFVDETIRVVTKDGTTHQGKLLGSSGGIILQQKDGSTLVIQSDDVRELSFPSLPEGLITKPTLMWLLEAGQAGAHNVQVSYLTGGMDWQADYVLALSPDDTKADLTGWVSVDNKSGATFKDTHLKLVAGSLHRVWPTPAPRVMLKEERPAAAPTEQVQERAIFEYHLYDVKRPVTLKDNQTKQIEFVTASEVPVEKWFVLDSGRSYIWRGNKQQGNVQVQIRFKNDADSGLGIPLPKGKVRIYKEDTDGSQQFVGEDAIDHTPKDEKVSLIVGKAFDVVGERTMTDHKNLGERARQESWKITLRNHKDSAATIHVIEHPGRWAEWEVVKESQKHEKLDAGTIEYLVDVPANGEATVTYTIIFRW